MDKEHLVNVIMLGGRGAGKTSLLAGLYNSLKNDLLASPIMISALEGTGEKLGKQFHSLQKFGFSGKKVDSIEPTKIPLTHTFEISPRDRESSSNSLLLKFTDYPGEFIHVNPDYVRQRVKDSQIVLIAIESTALMSSDRNRHNEINAVQQVSDLIFEVIDSDTRDRLILLVPIKGESWLRISESEGDLINAVETGYGDLISKVKEISENKERNNIALVVTPIQTIGSIVLDRYGTDDMGREEPIFKKVAPNAPFKPVDTEQPLKYLLVFLLNVFLRDNRTSDKGSIRVKEALDEIKSGMDIYDGLKTLGKGLATYAGTGLSTLFERAGFEGSTFWNTYIGNMLSLFIGDKEFQEAMIDFSKSVKYKSPFKIITGSEKYFKEIDDEE